MKPIYPHPFSVNFRSLRLRNTRYQDGPNKPAFKWKVFLTSSVYLFIPILLSLVLSACVPQWGSLFTLPTPTLTITPTASQTASPTASATATSTLTPTSTDTPLPPTPTFTPTWAWQPAGEVTCPILLYHRVEDLDTPSRYAIPLADFAAQMQALHEWGFTVIPISLLEQAINQGAALPPRPVVITFDDGYQSVYDHAFPIMRQYGFPGVNYIIAEALSGEGRMTRLELQEMAASGWEVGSHSLSHLNLQNFPDQTWVQASQSRQYLLDELDLPVDTFAYPYGAADGFTMEKVSQYGYKAAVGLGISNLQGWYNLFYLSRREVMYGATLDDFAVLLGWSGQVP